MVVIEIKVIIWEYFIDLTVGAAALIRKAPGGKSFKNIPIFRNLTVIRYSDKNAPLLVIFPHVHSLVVLKRALAVTSDKTWNQNNCFQHFS